MTDIDLLPMHDGPTAPWSWRRFTSMLILGVAVAALAGCATAPKKSGKHGKEYFSEKKYGVKASPRVASKHDKIRKGGGRYLVGKPYKVAGRWYKPRAVSHYSKTGKASWYGSAFHGRLTANGEVYDMNGLTAAHPTLPLPSYVRVTNLKNNRSVVVRVNDRGPFHGHRLIDVSKRTAELLDYKRFGVARVKIDYIGRAPLHGHDQEYLMASYSGPGHPGRDLPKGITEPGASMPGTMLASIDDAPVREAIGKAPTPPQRPFAVPIRSVQVAYDPAAAFSSPSPDASMMVASLESEQAPGARDEEKPAGTSLVDTPIPSQSEGKTSSATSTYSPDGLADRRQRRGNDARAVQTVAFAAPVRTERPGRDSAVRRVAYEASPTPAPTSTRGTPPRSLGTLPAKAVYGTGGPYHPLPPASIGATTRAPASKGPMVLISDDRGAAAMVPGALFYAPSYRVAEAHQVLAHAAPNSVPLRVLAAQHEPMASAGDIAVQVGVFGDHDNVARLERMLKRYGTVETHQMTLDGRTVTAVTLAAFAPGVSADEAVRAAEALGARGARIVGDAAK